MATRDLINLGIAPDSGTGDSARLGGEKINTLMTDIYTNFGDFPIDNNPTSRYYGLPLSFDPDFVPLYKVGELHSSGYYMPTSFVPTNSSASAKYNAITGYDDILDADGDGIPDLYRDSEWYFLSRGESINADLRHVPARGVVHLVLPLAMPGDQIRVIDGFGTWGNKTISIWTTPYEFQNQTQYTTYLSGVGYSSINSEAVSCYSLTSYKSVENNKTSNLLSTVYKSTTSFDTGAHPGLTFTFSDTTDSYGNRVSPVFLSPDSGDSERYELIFTYTGKSGWIVKETLLFSPDVDASILAINKNLSAGINIIAHDVFTQKNPDGTYTDVDISGLKNLSLISAAPNALKFKGMDNSVSIKFGADESVVINGTTYDSRVLEVKLDSDVVIEGNLTVKRGLVVHGLTTMLETQNVSTKDSLLLLNKDAGVNNLVDSGIIIRRGTDPTEPSVGAIWNEQQNTFEIGYTTATGNTDEATIDTQFIRLTDNGGWLNTENVANNRNAIVTRGFLTDEIAIEAETRRKADSDLKKWLDSETENRRANDNAIIIAYTTGDTTLQTNINNEAEIRRKADSDLKKWLDSETENRRANDNAIIIAYKAADTLLQTNINIEAEIRRKADSDLKKWLDSETENRRANDNAIITLINANTTTTTVLQSNIDAQAEIRRKTDSDLKKAIDSEILVRTLITTGLTLDLVDIPNTAIDSDNDMIFRLRNTSGNIIKDVTLIHTDSIIVIPDIANRRFRLHVAIVDGGIY